MYTMPSIAPISTRHTESLPVEIDPATVHVVPDQMTIQAHTYAYEMPRIAEDSLAQPVYIPEQPGNHALFFLPVPVP